MDNNNYKRRALGKGLEELFNNENINFNQIEEKILDASSIDEIVELPVDELRPNPYQPRKVFDLEKLNELANSIKEHASTNRWEGSAGSISPSGITTGGSAARIC